MDATTDDDLTPEEVAAYGRLPDHAKHTMRGALHVAQGIEALTRFDDYAAEGHFAAARAFLRVGELARSIAESAP